jgi:hypothetical protein
MRKGCSTVPVPIRYSELSRWTVVVFCPSDLASTALLCSLNVSSNFPRDYDLESLSGIADGCESEQH